jgi:hypothetical protein
MTNPGSRVDACIGLLSTVERAFQLSGKPGRLNAQEAGEALLFSKRDASLRQ